MGNSKKIITSSDEEPGGCKCVVLEEENWHSAYSNSLTNIEDLPQFLPLKEEEILLLKQVTKTYPMRIPLYCLSLIQEPLNPHDPIRRQCIPSGEEISEGLHEMIDPLGEEKTSPTPYLVHRYPDRVLLIATGYCFMYCRHCTRKRLWNNRSPEPTLKDIEDALHYVKANRQIREIIISGGDPLTLSTEKLDYILSAFAPLDNIEAVRIGTRAPVVLPQRIDDSLCRALEKYDNLWINVQFNHPREITPQSADACRKLQRCGIPINNQSVLLRGINDDPEIMRELCHKLQSIRVRPYYLFQCDPVVGASHFRTPVFKGVEIVEKMRGHTSGMCLPTFVVDGVEGKGKVPLSPNYVVSCSKEGIVLRNYKNETFFYYNPPDGQNHNPSKKIHKKVSTIGIAFNLKKEAAEDDRYEEYDEIETIEALRKELEEMGFSVVLLEQEMDFMNNAAMHKVDFVLNIAEGVGSTRARESQSPCILESLGIPYFGSDPVALGITLDKYLTNWMLKSVHIPVPEMYMVNKTEEINALQNIFEKKELFLVKPRWEGSSKGIFLNSLVDNFGDLRERVAFILSRYNQPALVEEFLEKEEITVGVSGNGSPRILGMMKIVPRDPSQKMFIYSLETKRDWQEKVAYEPQETISQAIQTQIHQHALKAFSTLELRDVARIDFRVDRDDIPKIIDINPLPGLSPYYSDLPILYRLKGGSYSDLLKTMLKESFKRCGLRWQ